MQEQQVAEQRLKNQHLLTPLKNPAQVVSWLGAVQAQDFPGATWAVGQRCGAMQQQVINDFNNGKILRTHMLRPTWHFVVPADILWVQELTGPRVLATTNSYFKKLGLDESILKKANAVLANALKGGKQLTRAEVKQVYASAKIDTTGLKLGFLIMYAELQGLICSGPIAGKQHTYMLLAERTPQAKSLPRKKALAELTKRFFTSHGPATIKDFSWWSSLTVADIKQGIELAKLKSFDLNGQVFYFSNNQAGELKTPIIHLLPNYDELLVAYKVRSATMSEGLSKVPSYEDLSYHIVTQDGRVIGGWKRQVTRDSFNVKLNLFKKLGVAEQSALEHAANNLQKFSGLKVNLI